jgi:hypothetical protein
MAYERPTTGLGPVARELLAQAEAFENSLSTTPAPAATEQTTNDASSASTAEGAQGTAETATGDVSATSSGEPATGASSDDENEDISDIPAHLQPRAKQLIEKRKAEKARADELQEKLAAYEAREAETASSAAPNTTGQADGSTSTGADAVDDAPLVIGTTAAETAHTEAKTAFETWDAQMVTARESLIASLQAKVRDGEMTYAEAEADLAQKDNVVRGQYAQYKNHVDRLEIDAEKSKIKEKARVEGIRASLKPLIAANPLVPPAVLEMYAAQSQDIQPVAEWFTNQNKPIVDRAVGKAVAEAIAPKDAKIAELTAEIERLNKVGTNNAAAAPSIASRGKGNGTAPAIGASPAPSNGYGFKESALRLLNGR